LLFNIYNHMKYIRKFNEGKNITDELKEFCSESLAYLIDDGYKVNYARFFSINDKTHYTVVNIKKDDRISDFTWYDVRDDVIPFMAILSRNYDTSSIKLKHIVTTDKGSYIASKHVKLSDIINDIIEDMSIIVIDFNVKNI
jgi:transposase